MMTVESELMRERRRRGALVTRGGVTGARKIGVREEKRVRC